MNTTAPNRGRVLAVMVAALLVAGLAMAIADSVQGNWRPVFMLVCNAVLAIVPFVLARLTPATAGFDARWWPTSSWHWVWFLGLLVLLFAAELPSAVIALLTGTVPPRASATLTAPEAHLLQAISLVLTGPVAEEIFFRGYLQDQLRKLAHSSIALWVQSLLFALVHFIFWGFNSFSLLGSLGTLLFGLIAGLWRIKFRSLLPIVLGHILCNAIGIPDLVEGYKQAVSQRDAAETAQADQNDRTPTQELLDRATALFHEGKYQLALADAERLLELEPDDFAGHYIAGWIYGTCPDPACREKEKALLHATKAVDLWLEAVPGTEPTYGMAWACLAAAHAEGGDFEKAIEYQKKAIEWLPAVAEEWRPSVEPRVKACLLLYEARKPLRSKAMSLGRVSDAWLESMSNENPEEFPEIAD